MQKRLRPAGSKVDAVVVLTVVVHLCCLDRLNLIDGDNDCHVEELVNNKKVGGRLLVMCTMLLSNRSHMAVADTTEVPADGRDNHGQDRWVGLARTPWEAVDRSC